MFVCKKKKWASFFTLLIVGSLILSACAPPTPEVIEKKVVVEKEVPVTVEVEKEVVVEKEVTKIVEKVVTATPVPQREVVLGFTSDPPAVDPHVSATTMAIETVDCMFNPLVQKDRHLSIVPDLAESWEIVDPKTYVFKLRKGVRFHNGEEFTASDVEFTFERMLTSKGMKRYVEQFVESVEVIDDYTVQLNLKIAYAPFLKRVPTFYIVPEDYIKAVGDEEFARHPIGTGPYKFVEWVHDDHLTLEANEDYWEGPPEIKRIV